MSKGSGGIKLHGSTKQIQHAQPVDRGALTCSQCGAQQVQHLAVQDGWKAGVHPTSGLAWVCSKEVCRRVAAEKGVVIGR